MDPENIKPDAAESKRGDAKGVDPQVSGAASARAEAGQPVIVQSQPSQKKITEREFGRVSRRELLKVAPVLVLGAFAIPSLQQALLKKGLGFSDWASKELFRRGHLAPTFDDAEVTPFEKFPINGYDVDDPGVIFENWSFTVSGAVQKPGDYRLAQIQALQRVRQNTQ